MAASLPDTSRRVMSSNEPECLTTGRCIYPLQAQFAHAVNTEKKLRSVLADIVAKADAPVRERVNFLEIDVIKSAEDIPDIVPVLGHDPGSRHDLTLKSFFQMIYDTLITTGDAHNRTRIGIKFDFKETRVIEPALFVLSEWEKRIQDVLLDVIMDANTYNSNYKSLPRQIRPALILNSDILTARPIAVFHLFDDERSEAETTLQTFVDYFPSAIYSIGWKTMLEGRYYSHKDVSKMLDVVSSCRLSREKSNADPMVITYAIRASWFSNSWEDMPRLLGENPYSTLTLWSNTKLDSGKIEFIEKNALHQASLYSRAILDLYIPIWVDLVETKENMGTTIPDNGENLTIKKR